MSESEATSIRLKSKARNESPFIFPEAEENKKMFIDLKIN
jgi:hypothetical protein